jgi:flagellar assembly protein FliH
VGAEEKKLLHNTEAGPSENCQTGFRLHCFPDIQVEQSDNARVCLSLEDNFQRVRYDKGGTASMNPSSNFGHHEIGQDQKFSAADPLNEQIYQKGFNEGLEQGKSEGEKAGVELAAGKIEPLVNSLKSELLQLKNIRQETYRYIEKQVVDLALAIARKVVCREIEMDKEVVMCVAREAFAKVDDAVKIKIKMSPSDLQFIDETKYQLSDLIDNIDNVTLEAEENIQRGGCILETNLGEIDARIEKQLQAVEESFRNTLENSGTEG